MAQRTDRSICCIACGSLRVVDTEMRIEGRFAFLKCRDCGLGKVDFESLKGNGNDGHAEVPYDEYWDEINQSIYAQEPVVSELRKKYSRYYSKIKPMMPNPSILEVGSGAGISVDLAIRTFGFEAMGVEPSKNAVTMSQQRYSIPVKCGLLLLEDDLPKHYGAVTLWDVIEHVADPEGLINACSAHICDGALLILETPDENTFLRSLIRARERLISRDRRLPKAIYYRSHRYYFTRKAMRKLLERCGFCAISFYRERSMYRKELLKIHLYDSPSRTNLFLHRVLFALLGHLPLLHNKMVVVARRRLAPPGGTPA